MKEKYGAEYWKEREFSSKYWFMTFNWLEHFEPQSVLDYGCGLGYFVHCWRYLGVDAVGFEISDYAVENAYKLAKGNTACAVPKGSFELVTCIDVLEHVDVKNAEEIIRALYGKTKKGHCCLFSICMAGDENFEKDDTHVLRRTRAWWEHKIEEGGFALLPVPEHFPFKQQFLLGFKK